MNISLRILSHPPGKEKHPAREKMYARQDGGTFSLAKKRNLLYNRLIQIPKGDCIMAFLDELSKKAQAYAGVAVDKAKDLAETAGEKAKSATETAKINMAILLEQRELDKNYKAIGEWFVAEYGQEIPEAVKDVVDAVLASKAKIAELEASKPQKDGGAVYTENGARVCPVCGEASEGKFCPFCGAPMNSAE